MNTSSSYIQEAVSRYLDQVIAYREHLHRYPELSFQEYKTSEFISRTLTEIGIQHTTGWGGGTGVVAHLGQGERMIALRADIDALPIQEEGDHEYKSCHDGVMHACGHDVHTACLLGAAHVLKELEHSLPCRVRLIFQPGEEKLPGGASLMIRDGVLDGVSAIFGQHVTPGLEVGKIGYAPGHFMASCDEIYLTIKGRGGHAARPHLTIDPIMITSEVLQAVQTITSRNCNPLTPSVLSFGKVNTVGGATNIIPDEVILEGTFRTYDQVWRAQVHERLDSVVHAICSANRATADLNILKGYPSLYNDPDLTHMVVETIRARLPQTEVVALEPMMAAEDFSYYSEQVPACFLRLGTSSKEGEFTDSVHTPTFDIDYQALLIGMSFLTHAIFIDL